MSRPRTDAADDSHDPIAGPAPHQPACQAGSGRCEWCSIWRAAARRGLTWAAFMETVDDKAFRRKDPRVEWPELCGLPGGLR